MIENTQQVAGYAFDLDGDVRLAVRQTPDGGTEILRVDGSDLEQIYTCSYLERCYPSQFHPDDERFYLVSNKGEDVDLTRLMLMNVETGETELLESDPEGEVDFAGAFFHPETDELLMTYYVGDRVRM